MLEPEFTQVGDKIIGSAALRGAAEESEGRRYQVLTIREGRIVEMQGCRSRAAAERYARRT